MINNITIKDINENVRLGGNDMPKINHEEYEILKSLDEKWKWIARNEDRCLYALTEKPVKKYDPSLYWDTETREPYAALELFDERHLFQFIQWEDEEPYSIAELIEEYEYHNEPVGVLQIPQAKFDKHLNEIIAESVETEVKSKQELIDKWESAIEAAEFYGKGKEERLIEYMRDFVDDLNQLDEPEPKNITLQDITLQDITLRLWELPLNNRKLWLARLNDEFQEGYIVPLGLKTTDGEEQYLTLNGSYFASRRNKYLQQTFDTLEEIPEFYRGLAERVL